MWAAMSCTAAPRMEEIMENQSLIHREANCLSRFDRLPVKSEMLKIIAVLAAVSVVEAFDLGLIGQTVLVLKQIWNLGPAETGLLATCSTIGVVLGTFSCGFLSDRYGRKRVLFWAVFIFTVFTFMGPLMENFYWVVVMRFLSGLGSGAVFPIPYLYISELVGAKQRGVTFAYCNSILVLSYVLPSSFGAWAVATFPLEVAWKLPFLVGGLPIVMLYFIHKYMPESPRWLMRQNRHDEAEALVERLESSLGMEHDKNYMDPAILAAVNEARSGGGLTLSGGEPLQQGDFCLSILEEAEHRAVHTAMESCSQAPEETILAACGKLDYLLFDIKHLDSDAHKKATGMGNERILRNLAAVRSAYPHLLIHLRTPLIPGINDDEELIRRIVELARSMDAVHYELLPYHRMGEQKYRFLGREYPYGGPAQVDAGILARLRGIVEEVFPEKD